jgi:CheY-like chemotaxis protein
VRVLLRRRQVSIADAVHVPVYLARHSISGKRGGCMIVEPNDLTVIDDGGETLAFVQNRGKYLPKYDGIEILEAMRGNPAFAGVPVAVLSSSSSPREMDKMEAFGTDRFITRPPDLDEYLEIGLIVKKSARIEPNRWTSRRK